MKHYYCLKSLGRSWRVKIFIRNFAELPLSWDMSSYDWKLRKLRNYQKCLSWPPLSGYVAKSWLLSQFKEKKRKMKIKSQNTLNLSWLRQNYKELWAHVYGEKLLQIICFTSHIYEMVSVTINFFGFFGFLGHITNFGIVP